MSIYYRPEIQNRPVAKRRCRTAQLPPPFRQPPAPRVQGPHELRPLLCLIAIGALIATGFVFSLHYHFAAHAIECEDVQLKTTLDQLGSEQRHLELERSRALNPEELKRAASRQDNLAPLKLDLPAALRSWPAKKKEGATPRVTAPPSRESATLQRSTD